jgi:hypothetical protein
MMCLFKKAKMKHVDVQLQIPEGLSPDLIPIAQEASRIHESVMYSSQAQFEQAKIWRGINIWLGAPAAALAALGGSTILSSNSMSIVGVKATLLGGIMSLLAAAMTAILTTVNASRRHAQSQASGNAFLQLQTLARQFVLVDIRKIDYKTARDRLSDLTTSRDDLNKTADVPSRWAYHRGEKNINFGGGQSYAVDKEA